MTMMNFRFHWTVLFCLAVISLASAQHGVGTNTPNAQAALDISSPDKGLLIPRLSLVASATFAPVSGTASSSHNGLLVYNTNSSTTNGLTGEGFYTWQGGATGYWTRLTTAIDAVISGTTTNSTLRWDGSTWVENNALQSDGTASSTPTLFIDATNTRIGVGTSTPTVGLQVIGEGEFSSVYITDDSSVSNTVSNQGTSVIDDGDWAFDQSNNRIYLAKLSDNSTVRSGANQMVITDSGFVGLGTNSPDDQLEVTGSAQLAGALKDADGDTGTAGQLLSSTGSQLNWIDAPNTGTDSQTLAYGTGATATQTTIAISNTNALTLQASGSLRFSQTGTNTLELAVTQTDATKIIDADGDTQVQVEEGADEDTIRLDAAGLEVARLTSTQTTINTSLTVSDTLVAQNRIGVGTSTPTVGLQVIGEGEFSSVYITDDSSASSTISNQGTSVIDDGDWAFDQSNNRIYLAKQSDNSTVRSGTNQLVVTDSGDVGIGTSSINSNAKLDVNGDVYANGIQLTSDRRYKREISTLQNALATLLQLRGVRHNWVTETVNGRSFAQRWSLGVIAQELEAHVPELVSTDQNGYKSVDYPKITALLIEAIKEQQEQITAQELRLQKIEQQLGINN